MNEWMNEWITLYHVDKKIHIKCLAHIAEDMPRNSLQEVFCKNDVNSQENTCAKVSFLIKLHASGLQFYQKWDSDTSVSLRILWNF